MSPIRLLPHPGQLLCDLEEVPAFPGESFGLSYPENIGDVAAPVNSHALDWAWTALPGGALRCSGEARGELDFELLLAPGPDMVSVRFALTNRSSRAWQEAMAFNCLRCGLAVSTRDHDCLRHWVRGDGAFRRLIELPRVFGPRPAVQIYGIEGGPDPDDLPFVASFHATSSARLEPWMAIAARDGERLVATVAKPGLFLFQNQEYSCIHAATGFGTLFPGQTAVAENRVYLVEESLPGWYARMQAERW